MVIRGASVFGPDLHFHTGQDIVIRDGVFTAVSQNLTAPGEEAAESSRLLPGEEIVDGSGCYAIPGLIDIHFHGAMGQDVCDGTPGAFETIAAYEASIGVTSICPATLTLPAEELCGILKTGAEFARKQRSAAQEIGGKAGLIGFNMEGPFISHSKKGAQNEQFILQCDAGIAQQFLDASEGLVKLIGIAPEENPDFESFIDQMKGKVRISLAHTGADYAAAKRAFDAGACHAVHLFNAMTGLSHRDPGVVGAAVESPHVYAEMICDGVHIHSAMVRAAFKLFGPERIVLISDSMRAIGEDTHYGSIEPGKAGNVVLLRQSPALDLQAVILRGKVLR